MRNPLSKMVSVMEPSGIRRFFDVAATMENVISLGVGEPDFDTPWHIREEGIYSLEKGRTFYTSNAGLQPLREEITAYLKRRFALTYEPDEVIVTVGGSEAIDICFRTMLDPGDEVIIPEPCFVSYVPCVTMAGGVPVRLPLEEKDQFKLTKQKLLSAITEKTKMVVLPFPNNPTGAIMTREELQIVADIIKEKDLFVMSDEIYSELSYQGDHVSIASIPGMRERTVVINGFSKSYAMTGWRLGWIAAPLWVAKAAIKLQGQYTSGPSSISQKAAEIAYTGDQSSVETMRQAFERRRDLIVKLAKEIPGFKVNVPEGAFYLFPDCSSYFGKSYNGKTINSSSDLALFLLEEGLVACVGGDAFASSNNIRMSYATSEDKITEAFRRIKETLAKLK